MNLLSRGRIYLTKYVQKLPVRLCSVYWRSNMVDSFDQVLANQMLSGTKFSKPIKEMFPKWTKLDHFQLRPNIAVRLITHPPCDCEMRHRCPNYVSSIFVCLSLFIWFFQRSHRVRIVLRSASVCGCSKQRKPDSS